MCNCSGPRMWTDCVVALLSVGSAMDHRFLRCLKQHLKRCLRTRFQMARAGVTSPALPSRRQAKNLTMSLELYMEPLTIGKTAKHTSICLMRCSILSRKSSMSSGTGTP